MAFVLELCTDCTSFLVKLIKFESVQQFPGTRFPYSFNADTLSLPNQPLRIPLGESLI